VSVLKQLIFTPSCVICKRLGVDFCQSCTEKVRPFRARELSELDACFCAGEYSGWLREAIIGFKNGDPRYFELLSSLLHKTLKKFEIEEHWTLIPIPSSHQKIKERGFDSISRLCEGVNRQGSSLKLDTSNLYLRKTVIDQVGLSAVQRQENLNGAFGVRRTMFGKAIIVDDVVTTGATLNSAARALKYAGVQQVIAVTLCGSPKTR
jgi:ComF family protein